MALGVSKTDVYAEKLRFDPFAFRFSRDISYLRFLEALIMSNRSVPFRNRQELSNQTQPWCPRLSRSDLRRDLGPRSTDMTGEIIEKSLEEMDATRKVLYAKLSIEDTEHGMETPEDH